MSFDHGLLNLPLAKRGDIDSQIDAWKREQAAAKVAIARANTARLKELRPIAKSLVANLPASTLNAMAIKAGASVAQTRKRLQSEAHWNPARVIDVLSKKAA
jgi:hypothetical protein